MNNMTCPEIILFVAIPIATIIIVWLAYRHQCLLKDRAQRMRDALRHRDFTFRLPTKRLLFGERALQNALNDAGQEIQKLVAHNEIESWQRLSRVLTHEIMNATAPIQSITQAYLANSDIKGTKYEEGIRAIHDTSKGLAAFVESYRKMTQLQQPMFTDIKLFAFVDNISTLYPELNWNIDIPNDITIHADEDLMRQVFINIIKNAVEAEAHSVAIKHVANLNTQGQSATTFYKLQVSNDGHTISDEIAEDIFIPFFTTKKTGSGIGLSFSRQILMMQKLNLSLRERPVSGFNVTFEIENDA